MEYGLWNLSTGFWQPNSQANVPAENVARQTYYTTPGIPVIPPAIDISVSDAEMPHYALSGTQCFRPHMDFSSAKNFFVGRPTLASTVDDKSQLEAEGMLMMGAEINDGRNIESASNDSPQLPMTSTVAVDQRKVKLRRDSYDDDTTTPIEEYTRQQSFHHPMYGMLINNLVATCKEEDSQSDDGREPAAPITQMSSVTSTSVATCTENESSNSRSAGSSRAGYECGDCGLVANTRVALKKHMSHAHPDQLSSDDNAPSAAAVVCPVSSCRFRASDPVEMENHVARHVPEGANTKKSCPIALQRVRYEREEYRCEVCSYSCTIEKAYHKHLKIHSMGLTAAIKISCVICGKDRLSEVEMNKHMKKHRDDRYFCCDICIFKTVQLKKLIQHRRMHTGEKPHLCPHCSYRSARRDNLRSHVRRVHKKDNLFCDTFSPRSLLLSARPSAVTQDAPSASPAPSQNQD